MKRITVALLVLIVPFLLHADTVRLGTVVVPRAQGVSLSVDPRADTFAGSVAVELDVRQATSTFRFHAEGLTITSLKVRPLSREMAVTAAPGNAPLVSSVTVPRMVAS